MKAWSATRIVAVIALLLCIGLPVEAGVQGSLREKLRAADIGNTTVSVYVTNLTTGQELADINADEPMMPASNMKLITTAAAMYVLSPDFEFNTDLVLHDTKDGKPPVLRVRGDGDPAFGDPKLLRQNNMDIEDLLQLWVAAVKKTGLTRFSRLVIDDRVFDQEFVHPTWPADQLNAWYCAQVAGLNVNDNCLDVLFEPTTRGQSPLVKFSPIAPFLLSGATNRAVTGDSDKFWINRKIGTNELTFWGTVKNRSRTPVSVTIHDPPSFLGQLLESRLKQAGVTVDRIDRPTLQDHFDDGVVLHRVKSTLAAVLYRTNKDSQNMFAECLLKRMGHKFTGAPGGWDNGAAAVRRVLTTLMGPKASIVTIADGSGLSRDNRVTARILVNLLDKVNSDTRMVDIFRESLSVAGEDGTLRKRLKGDMAGEVFGKSGYIRGVSALSGYIIIPTANPDNTPQVVAFSFLFNNVPVINVPQVRALQDEFLKIIDADVSAQAAPVNIGG